MELFLIRHGETKSNLERRYIGATDEGLSDEGRNKLLSIKARGIYTVPDILFVSPMLRCRQTAEIIFPDTGYMCVPEFKEIDFGIFEGKNHEELDGNSDYQRWLDSDGELAIKNGESRDEFIHRTVKGFSIVMSEIEEWDKLCKPSGAPAGNVIKASIIAHGGTIMALLSSLYGGNYYDYIVNCGEGYRCYVNMTASGLVTVSDVKKIC